MIAGAAMQAGIPLKVSMPVYEVMNGGTFPAGLDPLKKTMTLENLLTMSSGYFCDDTNDKAPGNEETMTEVSTEPDFYKFTMAVRRSSRRRARTPSIAARARTWRWA